MGQHNGVKGHPCNTVADCITQASLAYKGGKGLFDWTQGKEAYTDKLGEFHKAVEPFSGPSGQNLFDSWSQSFRDMPINSLFGDTAPMMLNPNIGGMGWSFPPPQTASNLMGSPTSAYAGANAGLNEAALAAQAGQTVGDVSATAGGTSTALQTGAKGAGSSFSSALPYLSIGLDLGMGGNTPITGDPYGDAAVRAAAAYATGGFSELGYGLGSLFDWW